MDQDTILIIDDEAEIVSLLKRMLGRQDFKVHTAQSLTEGWSCLLQINPNILFLDVNLPDGNGLEALTPILEKFPNLNVVMISAFGMEEDRKLASQKGAFSFLSKPFNQIQVSELIQQFKTVKAQKQ